MDTWFLLFDGVSPDGMGQPDYVGRTTDKKKARDHYEECKDDPYCTGKVMIVTDASYTVASSFTNWDAL